MHSSIVFTVFGLVASASAHMKMSEPKGWFVNNSPLDASGSDFPCKAVDYNAQAEMNTYQQGQSAPLTFIGQAVHGGGSCQIVLTKDTAPTKASVWKVIKSIEGGCPAQGEAGNMGDNAEAEDPYKYEFVIPKQIPAGKYTIAWTWFNKIGNREMYMNCGPATITGDSGDDSFFNSLPDMFTANIGNGCGTPSSTDLKFPNPGAVVERLNGATDAFADPTGNCAAAVAAPAAPTDAGSGPYKSGPSDSGASAPAPSKGSGGDSGSGLPGGVFVTAAPDAGAAGAVPTQAATLPAPDTPVPTPDASSGETGSDSKGDGSSSSDSSAEAPAPAPAASSPASGGSSSSTGGSGSAFPAGTACTQEGYWNCIGGTQFQRCASGAWSASMALSAGTSCSGGMSENIALQKRGLPIKAPRFAARMKI